MASKRERDPRANAGQQGVPSYRRAVRFRDDRDAAKVYRRIRDLLFVSQPSDLSVYRVLVDDKPHVAVIGDSPASDIERQIARLLAAGEAVLLPIDIIERLARRRSQARQLGPWVEGRHRPGRHL